MNEEEKEKRKSDIYDETLPFLRWRLANPTLTLLESLTLYKENLLQELRK